MYLLRGKGGEGSKHKFWLEPMEGKSLHSIVECSGFNVAQIYKIWLVHLDKNWIFAYFFSRNHQQNVKVLWKRTCEAKRIYDLKCREEVASNQFYHQEVARCGKISKEAEKVSIEVRTYVKTVAFSVLPPQISEVFLTVVGQNNLGNKIPIISIRSKVNAKYQSLLY